MPAQLRKDPRPGDVLRRGRTDLALRVGVFRHRPFDPRPLAGVERMERREGRRRYLGAVFAFWRAVHLVMCGILGPSAALGVLNRERAAC
jgi:hypothetical protein